MSITESPKVGQPRIAKGTFVVFSFDPAAYASFLDPEDGLLSAAASEIKRKKYLGIVEKVGPLDLPRLRQNLDIRVVGLKPPQEGEDDVYPTNPTRCVPVHPCTNHSDGRMSLHPTAPLPWSEAYVHTLQLVNAFISRVHHSNPTNAVVPKEEMRCLSKCVVHDQYAAADEARALESDRDETESDDESDCGSDADSSYVSELEGEIEPKIIAPPDVYMEIWEDLHVASDLGEPKDVGADIDEITQIGKAWAERKNHARRAKTTTMSEWAARVAGSTQELGMFDPFSPAPGLFGFTDSRRLSSDVDMDPQVPGEYPGISCDDLRPEDAIDERAARAVSASHMTPSHDGGVGAQSVHHPRNEDLEATTGQQLEQKRRGLMDLLVSCVQYILAL